MITHKTETISNNKYLTTSKIHNDDKFDYDHDVSTFQFMNDSFPMFIALNQTMITMDCYKITGVPLEDCPMCPDLECVPLLVRTCCKMVEDKGLDIVGIYRVPGNSAAVNALTEQVSPLYTLTTTTTTTRQRTVG